MLRLEFVTSICLALSLFLSTPALTFAQVDGDPPADAATPTESTPTDPAPADPAPADPAPADSAPADSAPAEPAPTEPAPTDTAPTESAPADQTPTDTTPTDSAPTDSAPTDSAPTDTAQTDSAPTDTPATDTPPVEETPITPTPAPAPVDQIAFAEPNDGELLGGSVFAVRLHVHDPLGTHVALFHGATQLASTATLVPVNDDVNGLRLATILIDSSSLPNGVEELRAELHDAAGEVLAEDLQSYTVDHPVAELIDADFQCCTLQTATIAVTDSGLVDSSVPYLVLASRTVGSGTFSIFGNVILPLPPLATQIVHSGVMSPTADAPTSLITIPVYQENVTEENPLHLVILTLVDGVWKSSGEVTLAH